MKFVCYSDWDKLPDSASILFEQAEKESVFFTRLWFESLATLELDDKQTIVLACVFDGTQVMAILPLAKNAGNTWYALKHDYTPGYSLLLAENNQPLVLTCLAQGLKQLPITGLILEPVANDDSKLIALQHALESSGFRCGIFFRHYNWIYRVHEQSFQHYIATRPAKLRNTIARKQRKLEREYGCDIRLFTGEGVSKAMSDYYTVYSASWKSHEQRVDFVSRVAAGFSIKDWCRLAILYIKEQPVAAQIWFVSHGKASIFRLAYDEMWRQFSPGSILTSYMMKHVIDVDKVKEIDFLTGNDAYKQDWMSERRERFALCFTKPAKPIGKLVRFRNWIGEQSFV